MTACNCEPGICYCIGPDEHAPYWRISLPWDDADSSPFQDIQDKFRELGDALQESGRRITQYFEKYTLPPKPAVTHAVLPDGTVLTRPRGKRMTPSTPVRDMIPRLLAPAAPSRPLAAQVGGRTLLIPAEDRPQSLIGDGGIPAPTLTTSALTAQYEAVYGKPPTSDH